MWNRNCNPSGAPGFTPVVNGVRIARSLVFCVVLYICTLLFVFSFFSLLVIVLSVLRFTASDYPFGIFKLFYFTIVAKKGKQH